MVLGAVFQNHGSGSFGPDVLFNVNVRHTRPKKGEMSSL